MIRIKTLPFDGATRTAIISCTNNIVKHAQNNISGRILSHAKLDIQQKRFMLSSIGLNHPIESSNTNLNHNFVNSFNDFARGAPVNFTFFLLSCQ